MTTQDCGAGEYCDAPKCKKKKSGSAACAANEECQSGTCLLSKCVP